MIVKRLSYGLAGFLLPLLLLLPAPAAHATIVRHIKTYYFTTDGKTTTTPDPYHEAVVTWRPGTTNQPWIIVIHGGSWMNSDPSSLAWPADYFSRQGFDVFNISYPLFKPGVTSYAQTQAGVMTALKWVRTYARWFGADPNRGAAFGFSAGGHLALEMGLAGDGNTGIKAIVTASGVVQPTRVADDALGMRPTTEPATSAEQSLYDVEKAITGCARTVKTPECIAAWDNFSPQSEISPHDPPVLMYAGGADPVVPWQSDEAVAYWLHKQHVSATYVVVPGMGHTFLTAFGTPAREAQMMNFLKYYTR